MRKQLRRIKRLILLAGVVGGVAALRAAKNQRSQWSDVGPPAAWPPLQVGDEPVGALGDVLAEPAHHVAAATTGTPVVADVPVAAVGVLGADDVAQAPTWVAPMDGACPLSHPVKAKGNSGIYHVPGGQFYERTRAERCYVDAAAAEADGYRAAKQSQPGGPAS